MGSCLNPILFAMGLLELLTPNNSANHVDQPPAQHSKKNICLITGEPWSQKAQGHHWDALEELELSCGSYDEAIESGALRRTQSPHRTKPYVLLGSLSPVGINAQGTQ